ncbi:MAG: GtrA family protein [Polyangiaceae bacterium]
MRLSKGLRQKLRTVVRSMGVGAVATLTDLVVLTLLASGFHLGPRTSSFPALVAGIAVQFFGNKLFAFEDRSKRWGEQAALFLAVEALGFVANLALFDVGVRYLPLPYLAVRLITTNLVYFGLCLPLWSRIFGRSPKKEPVS